MSKKNKSNQVQQPEPQPAQAPSQEPVVEVANNTNDETAVVDNDQPQTQDTVVADDTQTETQESNPEIEDEKAGESDTTDDSVDIASTDTPSESIDPGKPETLDHIVVDDPNKPEEETNSDPDETVDSDVKTQESDLVAPNNVEADTSTENPATDPAEGEPKAPEEPTQPVDTDKEEDEEVEKPLFVSDNGVLPVSITPGQQFVVGLSKKLEVGQKIKSGTKTFVVDWANDAHRSELDHRRNAYQTLLRLESRSERTLKTSDYFSEKAEFEVL